MLIYLREFKFFCSRGISFINQDSIFFYICDFHGRERGRAEEHKFSPWTVLVEAIETKSHCVDENVGESYTLYKVKKIILEL